MYIYYINLYYTIFNISAFLVFSLCTDVFLQIHLPHWIMGTFHSSITDLSIYRSYVKLQSHSGIKGLGIQNKTLTIYLCTYLCIYLCLIYLIISTEMQK